MNAFPLVYRPPVCRPRLPGRPRLNKTRMRIVIGSLSVCLLLSNPAFALRTYHVGNSLTFAINSAGLANWVAGRGGTHPYGYHINNGAKLNDIWNSPTHADFSVAPYGAHGNALPNYEWDVVTLEPFGLTTTDAARIADFVGSARSNPANNDAQFYLYENWPLRSNIGTGTYSAFWEQPWTGSGLSVTVRTQDYFQELADQVNSMPLGLEKGVLLVPVGDVLNAIDKRMRAGDVPGFNSVVELYLDDVHLKSGVGYFVVSTTFYATLYRQNPMGLPIPASMTSTVTPQFAAAVQRVAWDVVAGHPYSGVPETVAGDFNGDALVNAADYDLWKSTFGSRTDLRADANLNFVVDAADYTIWRNQLRTMGSGSLAPRTVPEPESVLMAIVMCSLELFRARRRFPGS